MKLNVVIFHVFFFVVSGHWLAIANIGVKARANAAVPTYTPVYAIVLSTPRTSYHAAFVILDVSNTYYSILVYSVLDNYGHIKNKICLLFSCRFWKPHLFYKFLTSNTTKIIHKSYAFYAFKTDTK